MKHSARFAVACGALAGLLFGAASHATDVSKRPLKADVNVKPNVIFGMDDSGSMDWEILLSAYNGILNWDTTTKSYWSGNDFLEKGTYYMSYLFPIGTGTGAGNYADTNSLGRGVPPSPQFAPLRSSAYNPLYYNPNITYSAWRPAYHDGALQTYSNATPSAAKSHPAVSGSVTLNLTTNQSYDFYYRPGMLKPDGSISTNTSSYVTTTYYPATYWAVTGVNGVPDCTADAPTASWSSTCVKAPDGRKLKRYEIKSGQTFPSGRSYADEMQNFANWWQYYRKRKLMLAGAMGSVLDDLTGMRLGVVAFNRRSGDVTMYDADATADSDNRHRVAGAFYTNPADSGTPTAATLMYIGEQYKTSTKAIQYSCQRNNAFVVTDGFANDTATPPTYDKTKYGSGAPYATTTAASIADIALAYFTLNLRNGRTKSGAGNPLSDGRVPLTNQAVKNPDSNNNLHMNTYAITLGASGTIWPDVTDPFGTAFTWPAPTPETPSAIDDLWHATINGRGQMYKADDPTQAAVAIQKGLNDMLNQAGAQSALSFSTVNLARGDGKTYMGSYTSSIWTGDVTANAVNATTAAVSATATWSASAQLDARTTARVIATSKGGVGKPFTEAEVGTLVDSTNTSQTSRQALVNYLRGSRSGEGTTYRQRASLIGPVVNAQPIVAADSKVVFAASGEGMLHAFDTDTGNELWAYVPGTVLPGMAKTSKLNYYYETLLDGTPSLVTVSGKRLLVAGLGAAGAGYYALDMTDPRSITTEAQLAGKVLWDIGNGNGFVLGQSIGRPVVVSTTSYGDVVLFTQGYNGSTDGKGRLYMVNANTGALLATLVADGGSSAGDIGLAQITAVKEDSGKTIHVYGGDLLGNIWHFNLESKTVTRLAQLKNGSSVAQPVTTAPAVVAYKTSSGTTIRIVIVGTGRLLGTSDFGRATVESVYAIKEGSELTNTRSSLAVRTITSDDVDGKDFSWDTGRGWYLDLPDNLQVTTDPSAALGSLTLVANKINVSECSANSTLFLIDIITGRNIKGLDYALFSLGETSASATSLLGVTDAQGRRQIAAIYRKSDGTVSTPRTIEISHDVKDRRSAWRIQRRDDDETSSK